MLRFTSSPVASVVANLLFNLVAAHDILANALNFTTNSQRRGVSWILFQTIWR